MGEPLSALEAASAIRDVAGWSDQLRQRVAGLTWMFWGIVTPAIFVTYALAASEGFAGESWLALLWLPWALLGLLFTWALWRGSRVTMSAPPVTGRELAVHAALFLLATVGSVAVVLSIHLPIVPPTAVVIGIGLLTAMMGVREAFGDSREVGVIQALGGILLIVFGVAQVAALANATPSDGILDAGIANAIASALVLVSIGAYRMARS